jgi:DNA-binding MarR family transcriptional regulator
MHRKLALRSREKVLIYLLRPPRRLRHTDEDESGPWNTQEGIAEGAGVPLKHVSEALKSLEREKNIRRGKSVHVNGGKRVRRTYLLSDSGQEAARQVADRYRQREVRVVTHEGEVETRPVAHVLRGDLDIHKYRSFVDQLDRWDRFDLRKEGF